MSGDLSGVSCVIPVFNEAESVAATLKGVEQALSAGGRPFEIIVVDDGSTDAFIQATQKTTASFQLVRHESNRGYGAAIKNGCRRAAHPWILIIDADGSYPPEEIGKLLNALGEDENADMIVGCRAQTAQTDGLVRRGAKRILTALANFLSGQKIPDLNSGLRLMRKSLVDRYRPLLPEGFSLTTSMTLALLCSGAAVRHIPIEYRRRQGKSKIRPVRDTWNFVALILRTITYFNPLKVFVPLAVVFVFAACATVILSKLLTGQVMDVTSLFLFIGGMQMLLIGVIADLVLKLTGMRDK